MTELEGQNVFPALPSCRKTTRAADVFLGAVNLAAQLVAGHPAPAENRARLIIDRFPEDIFEFHTQAVQQAVRCSAQPIAHGGHPTQNPPAAVEHGLPAGAHGRATRCGEGTCVRVDERIAYAALIGAVTEKVKPRGKVDAQLAIQVEPPLSCASAGAVAKARAANTMARNTKALMDAPTLTPAGIRGDGPNPLGNPGMVAHGRGHEGRRLSDV